MLAGENLALITSRLTKGETFKHVQVTKHISEVICMSPMTSNNGFVFPLYLYPDNSSEKTEQKKLADESWPPGKNGRIPNIGREFISNLQAKIGLCFISDNHGDLIDTFGPADVFNYIYAILHSPTYRKKYAEFLKIDFPRVPVTSNVELFRSLCTLGNELVSLHLLKSPKQEVSKFFTHFPITGDNLVDKGFPRFVVYEEGKPGYVYINTTQYLEGVPKDVWEFHIGGYQVCEKWLKDRRGRRLSYDEITHYQKVIIALKETILLMEEIDKATPKWPIR